MAIHVHTQFKTPLNVSRENTISPLLSHFLKLFSFPVHYTNKVKYYSILTLRYRAIKDKICQLYKVYNTKSIDISLYTSSQHKVITVQSYFLT